MINKVLANKNEENDIEIKPILLIIKWVNFSFVFIFSRLLSLRQLEKSPLQKQLGILQYSRIS